ncbi:MFS transporter [Streptomyces spiroverticillatus]|uniref:MFS transporter n=1 Tax=Streptomyces finlayi TaxID=67296 RepID=A0A918WS18_9ACTN|nr:MFS transporter [Streptomyces finlayi]GGZ84821.1 MFS transporter [Streptomyces spiroverticillatus]GHC76559.1 MFS transporter [Streptomyces finlayi]
MVTDRDAAAAGTALTRVTPAPDAQGTPVTPEDAPRSLVLGLAFAQLGLYLTVLTPVLVTLALRVAQLVPESERGGRLSLVLSVGAVLAMLGNPLFGALSDRTTGRFGRRRPWLLGGMAVALGGLTVVALGDSILTLTLGWAVAQLGCNAALCALASCLPDLIPEHQRGRVSGLVGMMISVAMVTGSFLAQLFHGSLLLAFLVPGAIGLVAVVYLASVMKDRPAAPGTFPPYRTKDFFGSFWISPRKHPDFARYFSARFMIFVADSCVTSYQVYFLMDRLGFSRSEVAQKMFLGTLIMVGSTVVGSLLGGNLSDRWGKRKPFVLASAALVAVALGMMAVTPSYGLFLLAMAVFGFGEGLYLSVDMAIGASVLPDKDSSAQGMGVLNIAIAFPQSLVPMIAPAVLAIGAGSADGGQNYGALFLFGALCAAGGAVAARLIRSVT